MRRDKSRQGCFEGLDDLCGLLEPPNIEALGGALLGEDQLRLEHRALVGRVGIITQLPFSTYYRTLCVLLLAALADAEPPPRITRPAMVFRLRSTFLARLNFLAFAWPPCFWKARSISFR